MKEEEGQFRETRWEGIEAKSSQRAAREQTREQQESSQRAAREQTREQQESSQRAARKEDERREQPESEGERRQRIGVEAGAVQPEGSEPRGQRSREDSAVKPESHQHYLFCPQHCYLASAHGEHMEVFSRRIPVEYSEPVRKM